MLLRRGVDDIIFEDFCDEDIRGPYPFEVGCGPQEVSLCFFYQAQDEVRIFWIQHLLVEIVKRFQGMAEMYWEFIEAQPACLSSPAWCFPGFWIKG
ncbi:MAG: hypothetical protein ABDK94_08460 [Atribacterota bacterium]